MGNQSSIRLRNYWEVFKELYDRSRYDVKDAPIELRKRIKNMSKVEKEILGIKSIRKNTSTSYILEHYDLPKDVIAGFRKWCSKRPDSPDFIHDLVYKSNTFLEIVNE